MSSDSWRSANSGRKSKRSLNSVSSNRSGDGNTSNKKKKGKQQTLGMAWGANSGSSRSSSFRNSPFADFGSYMVEKNRKLQNQFENEASCSSRGDLTAEKPLFHGVSIFVDGFTIPSSQELRGYMLKFGGQFENYFSRHLVTHIICSNLPDSKIKNLRSFSCGLPVVKPTWISESVAANKLLSWVPYQLDQLANNQPKLSAFFSPRRNSVSEEGLNHVIHQVKPETDISSLKDGTSEDANLPNVDDSIEKTRHAGAECKIDVYEIKNATMAEEPSSSNCISCDIKISESSKVGAEDEINPKTEIQYICPQPSDSVTKHCMLNQNVTELASSTVTGPSYHSTVGDPNFVENYFKHSRLHFIGTWRNRYRMRFPSSSNGSKCTSSDAGALANPRNTAIIHVDMDCFFVSVVIRSHHELKDKPVAVCHSDNPKGTAEISSANYPARDHGVRAGMFVRDAKALCPHLVIVPYNFEAYEEVADQFYNILHKHSNKVQAVSCDEAFLDITDSKEENPELFASRIRQEILDTTGCTASAGIAGNMLMARLATRTAKPDGQFYIPPEKVDSYLHQLPIKALPGIGHVLEDKLKKRKIGTCGQLRMIPKDTLQKDFGMKTGEMLWNCSRGVDNRLVGMVQESKSVGAEVNWGVRFKDSEDLKHFLQSLCKEVSLRLQGCGVLGRTFTLKIKKRRKDAKEPAKYMGCGDCENMSHSITVPAATDDAEVLQRIAKQLFGFFNIDVKEIRGIGLQVSKLESTDTVKQGLERNSLKSWLASASTSAEQQCNINCVAQKKVITDCEGENISGASGQLCVDSSGLIVRGNNDPSIGDAIACPKEVSALPPLCQLDVGVIGNLPPDLLAELNEQYGGKLIDFLAKRKGKSDIDSSSLCNTSHEQVEGWLNKGKGHLFPDPIQLKILHVENKEKHCPVEEVQAVATLGAGFYNEAVPIPHPGKTGLMPSSLSQVDTSVLLQLPEELRVDILDMLPAHRRQEFSSNVALDPPSGDCQETLGLEFTENHPRSVDSLSENNLWTGFPPKWVHKFKASNCVMLNFLSEMFYKSGSPENLSRILQCMVTKLHNPLVANCDSWDEAISSFCELLKQYIKLKIAVDIEEIYVCFRLLRRFAVKSKLVSEVYNTVVPYLQVFVGEKYGGNLNISLYE